MEFVALLSRLKDTVCKGVIESRVKLFIVLKDNPLRSLNFLLFFIVYEDANISVLKRDKMRSKRARATGVVALAVLLATITGKLVHYFQLYPLFSFN